MKIFAINLASQIQKKAHIMNECAQHGLQVEVVDAVDGRKLSEAQIHAQVDDFPACQLTRGEIGCALSHLHIYKKMVHEQIPFALVLEDDALLGDDISEVLQHIEALGQSSQQPQVYLLSPAQVYQTKASRKLIKHHHLHKIVDAYYAYAYVLNLAAAQTLSRFLMPIRYEADRWGYFQHMYDIQVQCVVPPVVQTNDEGKEKSDLENERVKVLKARGDYFRALRKKEMPTGKKLQRQVLKMLILTHMLKITKEEIKA